MEISNTEVFIMENLFLIINGCKLHRRGHHSVANSKKGYWIMAKILIQIFSNRIIAKLGYTSMLGYYLVVSNVRIFNFQHQLSSHTETLSEIFLQLLQVGKHDFIYQLVQFICQFRIQFFF